MANETIRQGFISWLSSQNLEMTLVDTLVSNVEMIGRRYEECSKQPYNIWHITEPTQIDTIMQSYTSGDLGRLSIPSEQAQYALVMMKKYMIHVKVTNSTTHIEWRTQSNVDDETDIRKRLESATAYLLEKYESCPAKTLRQLQDENKIISFVYFNNWTRQIYGKTAAEYLTAVGVLSEKKKDTRSIAERLDEITRELLERYKTQPATSLSQVLNENKDIMVSMINPWTRDLFGIAAKEYLINQGVIVEVSENKHSEVDGILSILKRHYRYGFRYDSIREMMRFRQFAEQENILLSDDDNKVKKQIVSRGMIIDGKVYVQDDGFETDLQSIIEQIYATGCQVIYYESLMEVYSQWMKEHFISSESILKDYLMKNVVGSSFSKKFMAKGEKRTEKEAVKSEIIRVWSGEQVEDMDSLKEKLSYIPANNFWRVILSCDEFVYVSEGKYLLLERLEIPDMTEDSICAYVDQEVDKLGYVALDSLPLDAVAEANYSLPLQTIQNAIYRLLLSKKYRLNGRLLTHSDNYLDTSMLLKRYLENRQDCTFSEAEAKATELTGGTSRQNIFRVLYDCMVRIDKQKYVSDESVLFDIEETDRVLDSMIIEGFCSVKEVATFSLFPVCGQHWNHFLLESYCYRFSKKYGLRMISFNDKNAGIIALKSIDSTYDDLLAVRISKTDMEINMENIGGFLFDNGYLTQRIYGNLEEIRRKAIALRKENR